MTWSPAHEGHAIERVAASVIFSDAMPSKLWQGMIVRIAALMRTARFAEQVLSEPTIRQNMPGPMVAEFVFGPQGIQLGAGGGARRYQLIDGGALREKIMFTTTMVSYSATRYTR